MDKELNTLYELCDVVKFELEELNNKVGHNKGMSSSEVEHLEKLTTSLVNIKCAIQKIEEDSGYSGEWNEPSMRGRMMTSHRGNSYRNRRTYSRDNAKEDFMMEVEELMNKAPDEHTRSKFERFLGEMR